MANAKKVAKTMKVRVSEAGAARDIQVKVGSTLRAALKAAGYDAAAVKKSLFVNGHERPLSYKLKRNDYITLTANVSGGIR